MGMAESSCPPPVMCPVVQADLHYNSPSSSPSFPTEAVLGGTLGGLSIIALALLVYAAVKHWHHTHRRRRRTPYRRTQTHRKNILAVFGEPVFAYDITGIPKNLHSHGHIGPDVYIARPYLSPGRLASQRQALASVLHPRDDSSEHEFCAGAGEDSRYEPSIVAGSFVYHPPTNLPPHLSRVGTHPHSHGQTDSEPHNNNNLSSYDSFKNDHLYDSTIHGIASSTLNNHHHPPDFYL